MMYKFMFAMLALMLCVGCDNASQKKAPQKKAPQKQETSSAGGHAPANYKPGSHEDWCGEHQVPESKCTRCNASLIPAFKATKDWCEEHQMPHSQCLACNPNLVIKRPAKK